MPIILDQPAPTAGFIFRLGSLDLSGFLRVNPDDPGHLDPYSQSFLEPAFTESPFADAQPLLSTTVQNREQMWPLFLQDPTTLKDQLHALIQAINNAGNQRPLAVEWRDAGASASTFYDVQFVRFEPDYNFRRSVHGYAAGTLHTWTAGYGHTGTTRVAGTAAGSGIFLSVPIASLAGDGPALLDVTVNAGALVPSLGRIVAVAPIIDPGYTPRIPAGSLSDLQPGATLIGDARADGSQYLALPVSPTAGASGVACKVPLPNPTVAGGDNRILAVVRSGLSGGVGVSAVDPYGNVLGATAVASMSELWGVVDLGVCRLPTIGYPTQPKLSILAGGVFASGADPPVVLASPGALQLNEILCLPERNLTLLLDSPAAASQISRDGFVSNAPLAGRNDDLGNAWKPGSNNVASNGLLYGGIAPGQLFLISAGPLGPPPGGIFAVGATPGAIDSAHLSAVYSETMQISARAFGRSASQGEVRLIKDVATGAYVEGRLSYASQYLSLLTNSGVRASVAIASMQSNWLRLSLGLQGNAGIVNLRRDDGGPISVAGASSAYASVGASLGGGLAARPGAAGVAIAQGASGFDPVVSAWEVDTIPSSNLQPYDAYRIDGVNADSYRQSSAGVFAGQKLAAVQRGAIPKMAPSTTSLAVICAPFDQGVANDVISAVVSVRERFQYSR